MGEYNSKKPKEFHLENSLYLRVLYTVRDYPRIIENIDDILYGNKKTEGSGKSGIGKPTETKAVKFAEQMNVKNAIDKALERIPTEYRKQVFENIVHKKAFPDYADRTTWSRWRMRFLYFVAENLKLL